MMMVAPARTSVLPCPAIVRPSVRPSVRPFVRSFVFSFLVFTLPMPSSFHSLSRIAGPVSVYEMVTSGLCEEGGLSSSMVLTAYALKL